MRATERRGKRGQNNRKPGTDGAQAACSDSALLRAGWPGAAGLGRVRLPSANELTGVRYQGRKITEVASKLHG